MRGRGMARALSAPPHIHLAFAQQRRAGSFAFADNERIDLIAFGRRRDIGIVIEYFFEFWDQRCRGEWFVGGFSDAGGQRVLQIFSVGRMLLIKGWSLFGWERAARCNRFRVAFFPVLQRFGQMVPFVFAAADTGNQFLDFGAVIFPADKGVISDCQYGEGFDIGAPADGVK